MYMMGHHLKGTLGFRGWERLHWGFSVAGGWPSSTLCRPRSGHERESVRSSGVSDSFQPHRLWPTKLLCPWNSPGKNTGIGCHALLQGIFLTQGSNLCLLCLLHWQANSLPLMPPGKPEPSEGNVQFSFRLHTKATLRQVPFGSRIGWSFEGLEA